MKVEAKLSKMRTKHISSKAQLPHCALWSSSHQLYPIFGQHANVNNAKKHFAIYEYLKFFCNHTMSTHAHTGTPKRRTEREAATWNERGKFPNGCKVFGKLAMQIMCMASDWCVVKLYQALDVEERKNYKILNENAWSCCLCGTCAISNMLQFFTLSFFSLQSHTLF